MLWYKSWRETRYRALFVFGIFVVFMCFIERNTDTRHASPQAVQNLLNFFTTYLTLIPVMLAGAGVKTQRIFQTARGFHGSMYFTLSLPVSRFRLLMTRAGLGMIETLGVLAALAAAAWFIFPALKLHVASADLLAYWLTVSTCISVFYFLSVFLATFLDDQWQIYGTYVAILALRWLSSEVSVPASINIFRAMNASSPLFTHSLPWTTMGVAFGAAAILFLAAMRVVQTHDY
jgi:hypothetical protein